MEFCWTDGFDEGDIRVLSDKDRFGPQPTGANIRRALARLVADACPGDFLFFHYSGHGTRLPAETGQQDDTGYDECIVPCDMNLITEADRHNNRKACILNDTTWILRDLLVQVESIRKEHSNLQNKSHNESYKCQRQQIILDSKKEMSYKATHVLAAIGSGAPASRRARILS